MSTKCNLLAEGGRKTQPGKCIRGGGTPAQRTRGQWTNARRAQRVGTFRSSAKKSRRGTYFRAFMVNLDARAYPWDAREVTITNRNTASFVESVNGKPLGDYGKGAKTSDEPQANQWSSNQHMSPNEMCCKTGKKKKKSGVKLTAHPDRSRLWETRVKG